ncbi:cell division site-positioning protein MapZ family protein [Enterococcus sp. BWT-B8]|uniref:cell division site-positioning protein MapZ family protein n=1 Tax=Enterococcus sp. BWT-B8 TaxID=2885157 RepID=UPI001E3B5739|nr:cell division site-positioning protein MapZ family protein [Enterococcus sp. BWT-B8]MCB5950731.1 cell division site-positioning protein MapZ family protein [Enterococcus sp. BWT-B8]
MTMHCPNCGNEVDDKEQTCPECGFKLSKEAADQEKKENTEQKNQKHLFKDSSSNFSTAEENENIEWADLKDLSIGHVMDLFNEQQSLGSKNATPVDADKEIIEKEPSDEESIEEAPSVQEKDSPELLSEVVDEDESLSNELEEQPDNQGVEDEVEPSSELSDTATLKDYIEAHKREVEAAEKRKLEGNTDLEFVSEISDESVENEEALKENQEKDDKLSFNDPIVEADTVNLLETDGVFEEKEQIDDSIAEESLSVEKSKVKEPFIPSKSKKPEEIEMDQAPIFFKETDVLPTELGPKRRPQSQFADLDKAERPNKKRATEAANRQKPPKQPKKKLPIAIATAAVLVLGAGGWYYSQNQTKDSPETTQSSSKEKLADETKASLKSYFLDDNQLYLKPDMVSVSTESIEANIEKLKEDNEYENLNKLLEKVKSKQATIKDVNTLFTATAITGDSYKEQPLAADKEVTLKKETGTDGFSKLINQAIDGATSQYDQLQNAKSAVDAIYKDDQARAILSDETYAAAVAEVDKIKNEALKKPLTEKLTKAKAALDADNAAQQNAASAAVETEAANVEVYSQTEVSNEANSAAANNTAGNANTAVDSSGFSAADSNGVYTAPVYTVNPADVADTGNAAWIWAAGVKERVIATCIERGYMVEGGYYLEPARIVNGQGYYNLYRTDGTYLVTINAQTGWFKGNASRNAGN